MSVLLLKADIRQRDLHVRLVPLADVEHLATLLLAVVHGETALSTRAAWRNASRRGRWGEARRLQGADAGYVGSVGSDEVSPDITRSVTVGADLVRGR